MGLPLSFWKKDSCPGFSIKEGDTNECVDDEPVYCLKKWEPVEFVLSEEQKAKLDEDFRLFWTQNSEKLVMDSWNSIYGDYVVKEDETESEPAKAESGNSP